MHMETTASTGKRAVWYIVGLNLIAAAVVLEYGGGGANAAPILRAVLDAVFGG